MHEWAWSGSRLVGGVVIVVVLVERRDHHAPIYILSLGDVLLGPKHPQSGHPAFYEWHHRKVYQSPRGPEAIL